MTTCSMLFYFHDDAAAGKKLRGQSILRGGEMSCTGFPSFPPPVYEPTKQVSLLDCKGLAAREAEHKKWVCGTQLVN